MIRTYSELIRLPTFKERFDYLSIKGAVGKETFGYDRYLNQRFYTSKEWQQLRTNVIARDLGCDLGLSGYEIGGKIIVHHMNPILPTDIVHSSEYLMDPEYLICVSAATHNAIHYGEDIVGSPIERTKNDTCPWKN